jgi:L-threonylcarbamoyladenylate synthase
VARAVLSALGEPIAAPSANRYQGLSPTAASHVVAQLGQAVDLVLDAGGCEAGIESTVVDVRGPVPRVLRPGAVAVRALRAVVIDLEARIEDWSCPPSSPAARASPGLEARHYAPRAALLLAASFEQAARAAGELAVQHRRVGLVVYVTPEAVPARVLVRELPRQPAEYARLLYGTLHDLDEAGVDVVVVQAVPEDDAWWAVADRLRRAATPSDADGMDL